MARLFAIILAGTFMGFACGSTGSPSATARPGAALSPPTTAQVQALLRKANEPITAWTTYTADTDVNKLLGRPHQYVTKLSWHDSRIADVPPQPNALAVDDGGGVEVFASSADRKPRFAELQAYAAQPLFAEYDYLVGTFTILRVSHKLTPAAAQGYQAALSGLG